MATEETEIETETEIENSDEIIIARRTESIDAPHIMKLVTPQTEDLFGRVNVNNLIEKAVFAITLVNGESEIIGHASFYDYPNLEDVDPTDWESWLSLFHSSKYTALNTLFLHYFVCKAELAIKCVQEIICTMFNAIPDIHFCLLVVPKDVHPENTLDLYFRPLKVKDNTEGPEKHEVFASYRYEHSPVLYVRKARVEDNDDVTPLFNSMSKTLKEKYGDYYIAELIEAQDDHMHCLVAEVGGYAIGLMSVSDNIDLEFLNENYDLGIFNGLRKSDIEQFITETTKAAEQEEREKESSDSLKTSVDENPSSNENLLAGTTKKKKKKKSVIITPDEENETVEEEKSQVQMNLSDVHMRSVSESSGGAGTGAGAEPSQTKEVADDQNSIYPQTPTQLIGEIIPTFKGEPNAFCIQLFAIDEKYEMRSEDFLMFAFELFPHMELCIITAPHLVPEFPLLQHFVRITPRLTSILAQELYVFHKSGLLKDFKVAPAVQSHVGDIKSLIKKIHRQEYLMEDIDQYLDAERDPDGTELKAFTATILSQVIGVAVIRGEEDIEYLRAHYNIEDYIYFNHHQRNEHAHLYHFALNPAFKYLTKHFIKEILRQGRKTCLYYPLFPPYTKPEVVGKHSLINSLREMVPVSSRRQIQYPLNLGINAPSSRIMKKVHPFALCHINRKLTLEPKVTINARIVVVGASTVGLAFLETLTYCPHLNFNNLTLVSTHGLPGEICPNSLQERMMASNFCYQSIDHAKIALRTWVNVVSGQMTGINRKEKRIVIDYESLLPYDHLVICTGLQYVIPKPDPNETSGPVPENVYVINDCYEANNVSNWLKDKVRSFFDDVIIYGETIDAYCCIQILLDLQVDADHIKFIHPPSTNPIKKVFPDSVVESAVLESLKNAGVKILDNYLFRYWGEKNEANISKAFFETPDGIVGMEFEAMFCYQKKQINYKIFKAVNDCCLVFDGFIVIDNCFHTNDSSIRAAGSVTKYKRKYYADHWVHKNFNSKEVGIALATEMLKLFDPLLVRNILDQKTKNVDTDLVPFYRTPKITGAILPGGYHYLYMTKPGAGHSQQTCLKEPDKGADLKTGSPNEPKGYFFINLNEYSAVETIICLRKQPFPALNFIQLYGLHERILNNLLQRYLEDLIEDFFVFFMESWCLAIYLDRFQDIREEIREKLCSDAGGIKEMLDTFLEDNSTETLSSSYANLLMRKYENRQQPRLSVESDLLSYLSYNYYSLPMYAKPGMI